LHKIIEIKNTNNSPLGAKGPAQKPFQKKHYLSPPKFKLMAKKIAKKSAKKTSKKSAKKSAPAKKSKAKASPKKAAKKVVKKAAKKATPAKVKISTTISPYLTFAGNCEEAFNFYKSVFGGNFAYVGRFKEMPPIPEKPLPASEGEKIMHISLPISQETVLMGSDSSEAFGHATVIGNNFSISVNAPSEAEADRIYRGLVSGGQAVMPMEKTFWGSYFGMLTDKYQIQWMVSCEPKQKK
jgi:PhnB protein